MSGLPTAHREIIVLREIEDLSYDEIAGALGCSVASVKVRLFRSRRVLKQRLTAILGDSQ
jgi:RNA polymerase sigma-70 factor (ECF subfamily)